MLPVIFRIPVPFFEGGLPIHGYGLAIVVGFLLATLAAAREARRRGLPEFVFDLGMVVLIAGIFGGRLFYYLIEYDDNFRGRSFLAFFKIWEGGLVFYGGAIFGFLGGLAYVLYRKLPLADALDVASLGAPIGMAFGRIGCFLNGCCYGRQCSPDAPLGVVFPVVSNVHGHQESLGLIGHDDPSLPVHPVQLYQALNDFILFGLMWYYLGRPGVPRGSGIPLLFVLYGIGRFFLEGMRGDHDLTWSGLTFSQNLSIVLVVVFGSVLILLYAKALNRRRGVP